MSKIKNVLVTGGAGYVGAVLIPKLLKQGYCVKVLDLYMYGDHVFKPIRNNLKLIQVKGDIRDSQLLDSEIPGSEAIIHLACISNDPSYELDPDLGKAINYDAFITLVDLAKKHHVKRFIYASSSSVYGIKEEENVTEDMPLDPLTDYSKYKALCERVLLDSFNNSCTATIVRPSTVCGYSPRQRLDLTVNILTNHAINKGRITVFGGEQKRPNLHIKDMTDLYLFLLDQSDHLIKNKTYNVGYENLKVIEIAEKVNKALGGTIPIIKTPTDDNRSYHVCSDKIKQELGFEARYTIEEAIFDLKNAFHSGLLPNPMDDMRYYNIKTMQHLKLT